MCEFCGGTANFTNKLLNAVLNQADNEALSSEQKEACLIAGGLLLAAKASVDQAVRILHDNELAICHDV